jgi:hypothetical protein
MDLPNLMTMVKGVASMPETGFIACLKSKIKIHDQERGRVEGVMVVVLAMIPRV